MGTLVGHVAPGIVFLLLGLWRLFSNIKLFCINPNTFTSSSSWFPISKIRHLELYIIMLSSSTTIAKEIFSIATRRHQLFDSSDGSILPNHLNDLEHSFIAVSFLVYAIFALVLDRAHSRSAEGLTNLAEAAAFAHELFLFHFHFSDHMGIEGQYHFILQLIIFVSLFTTLLGIAVPKSFLVNFVKSSSIAFQGVWFIVMGYMLYKPSLIPKGCLLHVNESHTMVKCSTEEALQKAKSLVNIEFSWLFVLTLIFSISLYLILEKVYGENIKYSSVTNKCQPEQDYEEQQHISKQFDSKIELSEFCSNGFINQIETTATL